MFEILIHRCILITLKLSVRKCNDDVVCFVARISVNMSDTEGCVLLDLLGSLHVTNAHVTIQMQSWLLLLGDTVARTAEFW